MVALGIDVSGLIGESIRDDSNMEIGKVTSFLIDSSGQVKEAFVQNSKGEFARYPVEKLRIGKNGLTLISDFTARLEALSERFPAMRRKRRILDKLMENNKIPSDTYTSLSKWLDKALEGMEKETESLLNEIDKQFVDQEDFIKTVQLARTYLEIEHAMGNVKNEVYHQSLMSLLKEIRNASQRKVSLQETKQELTDILIEEEEVLPEPEPQAERQAEPETQPRLMREPEISTDQKNVSPSPSSGQEGPPLRVHVTQEE